MSVNTVGLRVAVPYARALFDFSVEKHIMHKITDDFQKLSDLLDDTSELTKYLNNPIVSKDAKRDILTKAFKSQVDAETFKFLMILVTRNRINLLKAIIDNYLKLVYELASLKVVEVLTAYDFTASQTTALNEKLMKLGNTNNVRITVNVDPNLIGGFLLKTESKIVDFTIANQLQ
jgi:F-type H+-transporting ATPase subunit delta